MNPLHHRRATQTISLPGNYQTTAKMMARVESLYGVAKVVADVAKVADVVEVADVAKAVADVVEVVDVAKAVDVAKVVADVAEV